MEESRKRGYTNQNHDSKTSKITIMSELPSVDEEIGLGLLLTMERYIKNENVFLCNLLFWLKFKGAFNGSDVYDPLQTHVIV